MKKKFKLTKEEREIEKSLGGEEWAEAPDSLKKEIVEVAQHGVSTRKREARVNIRLMQGTVDIIRRKAEEEGLGYQTLMSSVLHKYASDRLVERSVINEVASEIALRVQGHGKKKASGDQE